jgi:predicted Zn-dependent protease
VRLLILPWYICCTWRSAYDEAQITVQKALDLNPQATYLHLTLDKSFITGGKSQQALTEIEREPSEWGKLTGQALAYHALGREQGFDAALAGLIAKYSIEGAYQNSSGVGVSRAVPRIVHMAGVCLSTARPRTA